jgi:hypothetical protein
MCDKFTPEVSLSNGVLQHLKGEFICTNRRKLWLGRSRCPLKAKKLMRGGDKRVVCCAAHHFGPAGCIPTPSSTLLVQFTKLKTNNCNFFN